MSRRPYRGGGGPPDNGVLTQRVDGLETGLSSFRSEVTTALKGLGDKIDARSQTPWPLIGGAASLAVTVIIAIGSMAFSPVNQGLADMRESIKAFAERAVTEKELAAVVQNAASRRDDAQRQAEDRFKRAEADIDGLQKAFVPRGEHERQWADQRRVDDGLKDDAKELRHRIEKLEDRGAAR